MTKYIQIITSVSKREDAEKIAQTLLDKKLAACVQIIGPIQSQYWWKGKIEKAKEFLILIKSRRDLYEKIEDTLKKIHPYTVPEILAVPVVVGNKDYLTWLEGELK